MRGVGYARVGYARVYCTRNVDVGVYNVLLSLPVGCLLVL